MLKARKTVASEMVAQRGMRHGRRAARSGTSGSTGFSISGNTPKIARQAASRDTKALVSCRAKGESGRACPPSALRRGAEILQWRNRVKANRFTRNLKVGQADAAMKPVRALRKSTPLPIGTFAAASTRTFGNYDSLIQRSGASFSGDGFASAGPACSEPRYGPADLPAAADLRPRLINSSMRAWKRPDLSARKLSSGT